MPRKKAQINLSVDKELWGRCQLLKEKLDVNWSEVAEFAFRSVLDSYEMLAAAYLKGESWDEAGDKAIVALTTMFTKSVADTYTAINDAKERQAESLAVSESDAA